MRAKWILAVGLAEALTVGVLLFLLRQDCLPDKLGVVLVWLLPMTLGLHLLEEFAIPGGLLGWNIQHRPRVAVWLTAGFLNRANRVAGFACWSLPLGAFDYMGGYSYVGIRAWLFLLCLAGTDAWHHLQGTIRAGRYCPGLVTACGLYLPLALVSIVHFLQAGAVDFFSVGVCLAMGPVFQVALGAARERRLKRRVTRPRAGG